MPDYTYSHVADDEEVQEVLGKAWFEFRQQMDAEESLETIDWVLDSWLTNSVDFIDKFLPLANLADRLAVDFDSTEEAARALYSVAYNSFYSNDEDYYECEG